MAPNASSRRSAALHLTGLAVLVAFAACGGGGSSNAPVVSSSSSGGSSGGSGSSSGGTPLDDAGNPIPPRMKDAGTPKACTATGPTGPTPNLTPGTWTNISPAGVPFGTMGANTVFTQGMVVDPCDPSTLYVTVDGFNTTTFDVIPGGLYRSTDAGSTWTKIGPFDAPIQIRVDPKNPAHLYVGDGVRGNTTGFWVSYDWGQTWSVPQGFSDISKSMLNGDTDVYRVEVDPTDFNHVLLTFHWYWDACNAGCNSGVLETMDGGDSWVAHPGNPGWANSGGYAVFFLFNPALGIGDSKTWLYGSQGAGYWRTTDGGNSWTQVTMNNLEHGGGEIYYTKAGVLYAGGYPHMMRSMDNGVTWTTIGQQAGYLAVTGDGTSLYTGLHEVTSPMLTSPEGDGNNWTPMGTQMFSGGPFELSFDATNRILYSGTTADGAWALKLP